MHSISRESAFHKHVNTMLAGNNERIDAMVQVPSPRKKCLGGGYCTSRKRVLYTAMRNNMTRVPGDASTTRRTLGVGEITRAHRLKIVHSHHCGNTLGYQLINHG